MNLNQVFLVIVLVAGLTIDIVLTQNLPVENDHGNEQHLHARESRQARLFRGRFNARPNESIVELGKSAEVFRQKIDLIYGTTTTTTTSTTTPSPTTTPTTTPTTSPTGTTNPTGTTTPTTPTTTTAVRTEATETPEETIVSDIPESLIEDISGAALELESEEPEESEEASAEEYYNDNGNDLLKNVQENRLNNNNNYPSASVRNKLEKIHFSDDEIKDDKIGDSLFLDRSENLRRYLALYESEDDDDEDVQNLNVDNHNDDESQYDSYDNGSGKYYSSNQNKRLEAQDQAIKKLQLQQDELAGRLLRRMHAQLRTEQELRKQAAEQSEKRLRKSRWNKTAKANERRMAIRRQREAKRAAINRKKNIKLVLKRLNARQSLINRMKQTASKDRRRLIAKLKKVLRTQKRQTVVRRQTSVKRQRQIKRQQKIIKQRAKLLRKHKKQMLNLRRRLKKRRGG